LNSTNYSSTAIFSGCMTWQKRITISTKGSHKWPTATLGSGLQLTSSERYLQLVPWTL
jgi:hypothetical protein